MVFSMQETAPSQWGGNCSTSQVKNTIKKIKLLLMGDASAQFTGEFPGRCLAEGSDLALQVIAGVKQETGFICEEL